MEREWGGGSCAQEIGPGPFECSVISRCLAASQGKWTREAECSRLWLHLPPIFHTPAQWGGWKLNTPPPRKKKIMAQHETSEAEREFDKATQSNKYLSADISIELFTDIWVTTVETLLPSKTHSLSTLPFKWVSVCLSVCKSQMPPSGCVLQETTMNGNLDRWVS